MAIKISKIIVSRKVFAFLNASYPKIHLIQSLNSLDSSRPYGRLLENQKTRGSKKLFLPKNDFQSSFTKNFPKKHSDIGGLKTNRRHEIQTLHLNSISYKSCSRHLVGTSSKCHKFWGQNLEKNSSKKDTKLNFTTFWALYLWKHLS